MRRGCGWKDLWSRQAKTSVFLLAALAVGWCVPVARGAADSSALPNPPGLRTQVEFWKKIFADYSTTEVVIHDAWELDRIYATLDFSAAKEELGGDVLPAYIQIRVDQEKERIRALLLWLHQNRGVPSSWSDEEKRIARLFARDPDPAKFLTASDPSRIRAQRGLKERFREGLRVSRGYLPEMEAIFRSEGVPVEITRLPLVESCFNLQVYSKAGAAGIWQFIPSTGRMFLRIDEVVDERRDPIASTRAAARFLRRNYERLGTWPLAITAYNHGPAGVERAVETLGTRDIVEIVRRYRGPRFGFASRNFYAEFLAAVEVDRDYERHFGPIPFERPRPVSRVVLRHAVPFSVLARSAGLEVEELADYNPALTPDVVRGKLRVPAGFRLQLPPTRVAAFERRLTAWASEQGAAKVASRTAGGGRPPAKAAERSPVVRQRRHRVQRGQTLTQIARLYGTTPERIRKHNGLKPGAPLPAGRVLVIPES